MFLWLYLDRWLTKMNRYELTIPYELPDLNTYNKVSRSKIGYRLANAMKQEAQTNIGYFVTAPKEKLETPVDVECIWYCKNAKKDPDNRAFAIKFILDTLVLKGVLENDGMKQIKSISHQFELADADGVKITLRSVKNADRSH